MSRGYWANLSVAFGLFLSTSCFAQFVNPDFGGEQYLVFLEANGGWAYTNRGIGPGVGYGGNAGVLGRFNTAFGSAYAGAGGYYLTADPDPGRVNSFGGQLLLRYKLGTGGLFLGTAQLTGVTGVDSTFHFAWGGHASLDFPIFRDVVTLGPGAAAIVFQPEDLTYTAYWAVVSLKFWW